MDYTEARQLALTARDRRSKPAENNTRVEIIDAETVGIRLHSTYVVKLRSDGSFELDSGGWRTVTTKDRINRYIPGGYPAQLRIGSHRVQGQSRWWVMDGNWTPLFPYVDGMRFTATGGLLNPELVPDIDATVAHDAELAKSIDRYLTAYLKAAKNGIYVDALYQEPEGAVSCWDCSMNAAGTPELEGRTTEGGDRLAHLVRHVAEKEIVPELAWAAMSSRGYRAEGIAYWLGAGIRDTYQVNIRQPERSTMVRAAMRTYLRQRLLTGISGARPNLTTGR